MDSQPVPRLVVKKATSQKKPVVVTAMPEFSNKNPSSRDNLLKSAQLKPGSSTSNQKSPVKVETTETNDDNSRRMVMSLVLKRIQVMLIVITDQCLKRKGPCTE